MRRPAFISMGRRSIFLLAFGVVYILIGYSYLQPIPKLQLLIIRQSLYPVLEHVTLKQLGWAWIVTGCIMTVGSLHPRVNWIGFGVAGLVPAAWVIIYTFAWRTGHNPRGWVTAIIYAAFGIAILIVATMPELSKHHPRPHRRQ